MPYDSIIESKEAASKGLSPWEVNIMYEDENNLYHYSYRKGDEQNPNAPIDTKNYAEDPWDKNPGGSPKKKGGSGLSGKIVALALVCALVGGFIGAGGGMMMLLILTSVLGYELKTAVGTSVFIMTFTALTGAVSHFMIGGAPDWGVWVLCVLFTLLWARIAAVFANKATPKTLNRATGVVLVVLGVVIMGFNLLS